MEPSVRFDLSGFGVVAKGRSRHTIDKDTMDRKKRKLYYIRRGSSQSVNME